MAWIVRTLLRAYKDKFGKPPKVKNRQKFQIPPVRFNVVFYGDKEIYKLWAREWGLELGPVIREIVHLYLIGEFSPNLSDALKQKKEKDFQAKAKYKRNSSKFKLNYQVKGDLYVKADFWPVNAVGNAWLMWRGLRNKKKSYVEEALSWHRRKFLIA